MTDPAFAASGETKAGRPAESGAPDGASVSRPRPARAGRLSRPTRLALTHLGACALAAGGGWAWFRLGLRFPPCMFNRITGLYCLTCGATRAVNAFLRGRLLDSLLLNPVPILLGLFLAVVTGFELVNAARGRDARFRWGLHGLVAVVAIAAVYCVARNLGFAPTPNELYP